MANSVLYSLVWFTLPGQHCHSTACKHLTTPGWFWLMLSIGASSAIALRRVTATVCTPSVLPRCQYTPKNVRLRPAVGLSARKNPFCRVSVFLLYGDSPLMRTLVPSKQL